MKPFSEALFLLQPDTVQSKNDGQMHFITAPNLARCYGVPMSQCVTRPDMKSRIVLRPLYSGAYRETLARLLLEHGFEAAP